MLTPFLVVVLPDLRDAGSRRTGGPLTIAGFLGWLTFWSWKVRTSFGKDAGNFVSFRLSPVAGFTDASLGITEEPVRDGLPVSLRFMVEGIAVWVLTPRFGRTCSSGRFRGRGGAAFPAPGLLITLADFARSWPSAAIARALALAEGELKIGREVPRLTTTLSPNCFLFTGSITNTVFVLTSTT
jgi:hypothetical protein